MTLRWNKCRDACISEYGFPDYSSYSSSQSYVNSSEIYEDPVDREYNLFKCQVDCFDDYLIYRCQSLNIPSKGKNYALRLIERLTSSLEGLPWHGFQSLDKQQIKCHMLTGKLHWKYPPEKSFSHDTSRRTK